MLGKDDVHINSNLDLIRGQALRSLNGSMGKIVIYISRGTVIYFPKICKKKVVLPGFFPSFIKLFIKTAQTIHLELFLGSFD